MTSRVFVLAAAFLCAALAPCWLASAQNTMPLRASYQGEFLPEGTEIVVLSKEGRVQRDGRYQPEFFPTREFPRDGRRTVRRERLGDAGRSIRAYEGTQDSGRLYFIYALTPDSTLYWSYSAQRDSLKYDVISTGVMSVAPVLTSEVREDVLRTFFRPRVTVVMRGENNGEKTVAAGDDSTDGDLHQDSPAAAADATELPARPAETTPAVQDTALASASPSRVASASATPVRSAAAGFSPLAFWSVFVLLLAAVAVSSYLARAYHAELKQVRREMLTLRDRAAVGNDYADLRTELEDARLRCEQLEEDYAILEARYAALERKVDASGVRSDSEVAS